MRKLIFASVFLLLTCSFSVGQDVAELAIIRGLLGVPPNTPVTSSNSAAVPKDTPLKVYLDVSGDAPERDKRVKDDLAQWIEEWNKATTEKRATLDLVTDPAEARVALIHFTDFPTEVVDPTAEAGGGESRGSGAAQAASVTSFSSTIRMSMMVHTYIVIKAPESLKILYRRKFQLLTRSTIVAGSQLTSAVTNKLKKEIVSEIDKRSIESRDEKDMKRSDYKMRDAFAKWMTSEDGSMRSQQKTDCGCDE